MSAPLQFTFRPVLTGLCVVMAGFLCWLGVWQLDRLDWKKALIAQVETRLNAPDIPFDEAVRRAEAGEWMEYSPVTLTGRYHYNKPAIVFGSYEGAAGGYFFVPVSASTQEFIYVNQGFASQGALRAGWPATRPSETPDETIRGLFRYLEEPAPPASWFQTKGKSADGLWFIRDPLAFAAEAGGSASSYYVDQIAVDGREWPKGGTTRVEFTNRHLEYALTWFGLAATLVGVWLAFSLQKRS